MNEEELAAKFAELEPFLDGIVLAVRQYVQEQITHAFPRHEWSGSRLRIELAPGEWGPWADLRGQAVSIPTDFMIRINGNLDGGRANDGKLGLNGGAGASTTHEPGVPGSLGAGAVYNPEVDGPTFNAGRAY